MARPGIILYGFDPSDEVRFGKFRPVMKLKTVVSMVKELQPGQSTSYGRRFTAEKPTKVATLCTGYADGYPRQLSCGKGIVEIHGTPCPVLGRRSQRQRRGHRPQDRYHFLRGALRRFPPGAPRLP